MATQATENRTERVVVLMTAGEKAALVDRARARKLGTGEYVRLAAAQFDAEAPDQDRAEMAMALAMAAEVLKGLNASLARHDAYLAQRPQMDEAALRARYREELSADPSIDWAALRQFLGIKA